MSDYEAEVKGIIQKNRTVIDWPFGGGSAVRRLNQDTLARDFIAALEAAEKRGRDSLDHSKCVTRLLCRKCNGAVQVGGCVCRGEDREQREVYIECLTHADQFRCGRVAGIREAVSYLKKRDADTYFEEAALTRLADEVERA